MTRRPGGPIWSAAVGQGGAWLRSSPSGPGWAGVLQCVRLCGLPSAGRNSSRGLHSGSGGAGPGFSGVCAGDVCGPLGGVCVPRGVGLPSVGVCGLSSVGGGEGYPAGWVLGGGVLLFGRVGGARVGGPWGCAPWWACVGLQVGSEGGGAWAGWGVLCRCMCPLAAARLPGQL